eukprot:987585-Alexandrium_andersonii.AAC.1
MASRELLHAFEHFVAQERRCQSAARGAPQLPRVGHQAPHPGRRGPDRRQRGLRRRPGHRGP